MIAIDTLNVQMHIMSLCLSASTWARNVQMLQCSYRGCEVAIDEREERRED